LEESMVRRGLRAIRRSRLRRISAATAVLNTHGEIRAAACHRRASSGTCFIHERFLRRWKHECSGGLGSPGHLATCPLIELIGAHLLPICLGKSHAYQVLRKDNPPRNVNPSAPGHNPPSLGVARLSDIFTAQNPAWKISDQSAARVAQPDDGADPSPA